MGEGERETPCAILEFKKLTDNFNCVHYYIMAFVDSLSTEAVNSQGLLLGCREIQHSQRWNQQAESMAANSGQHPRAPFSGSKIAAFCQEPARIGNPYLEDVFLQGYLESRLPPKVFAGVSMDLERFGARVKDEIDSLGRECELNPPRLQQFDAWGQRVDQIITCSAWKRMKVISAEEGLIAEAYERKYSSWSRVHQIAKLYLYAPSAGLFSSPLAMTDGAAKVIESLGIPEPLEEAYARLTSRDPRRFWTSGQWMTERKGGSDVANGTETVALKLPDGTYSLHGLKWFTTATDSDMTLTLARIMAADGRAEQQDLCPVDREDKAGSYDTEAPPLNSSLVYDANPILKGKL
ncbi:hypothetical protein lerEdw1_019419 [Lerista edwardsae]|nr:hypothetical protein lerEdw1_019419 [Lerista edwardsae]